MTAPIDLVYAAVLGAAGGLVGLFAAAVVLSLEDLDRRVEWAPAATRRDKARVALMHIHRYPDWRFILTSAVPRVVAASAALAVALLVAATGLWVIFT